MCNNCIHKIVCSKYIATGGVKSCEHFKEERKGRWEERYMAWDGYCCSVCSYRTGKSNFCPHCGADMRGNENG